MKNIWAIVIALFVLTAQVFAGAATSAVNTPSRSGMKSSFGVYTNTIIYAGTIVALNSSGYAVPAADASGYVVVGRASKTIDNRTNAEGAGDSGALTIEVERGVFGWTGNGISDTTIGSCAYVLNDNTVTNGSGTYAIIVGIVVDYSDGYAWVDTFSIPRTAGTFTTLAASGATTLASTLAVTGTSTLTNTTINGTLTMGGAKVITNATFNGCAVGPITSGGQAGYSGAFTNLGAGNTNIFNFYNGILTNVTQVAP